MGRTVAFHRKQRGQVRLDRDLLFEIEIRLAKEVDPDSGMTLNLVEVDEIFGKLWGHLKGREFATAREMIAAAHAFLEREIVARGAELREIEAWDLWAGTATAWRSSHPHEASSIRRLPLRVQLGEAGRVRTGEVRIRTLWAEGFVPESGVELVARDENEMCDLLAALDDQAAEVFFQDALTLESWRIEK